MTIAGYFKHYISMPDMAIFFGLALLLVVVSNLILYAFSRISADRHAARAVEAATMQSVFENVRSYEYEKQNYIYNRYLSLSQRFYEIIFSGNCILFFMTVYYLIYRFFELEPYKSFFRKYDSFLLLLLIVISCLLNTLLDRVLVRLTHLDNQERASIKILGMLYMLIIFAYIKYVDNNNNYDMYITYFLGLMVGRFVYFDASFKDFIQNIGHALANIPIMLLALFCSGSLAIYGLSTKYLIRHIGVVTNIFISHIFLCIVIFIIFHLHPERLFMPKAD